jgi:polygalacturonase
VTVKSCERLRNVTPLPGVLNVRDFGAKGDGVTDDTAAIQKVIDTSAGRKVYLPSGVYRVSQTGSQAFALRAVSGLTLLGDGSASILKLAPNQGQWCRVLSGSGVSNVTLQAFAVDGTDDQQLAWSEQRHGIFFTKSVNIRCNGLFPGNTSGDGIFYYGGTTGIIENCVATGGAVLKNARVGINFQGANHSIVRNNLVTKYDTCYKAELDAGNADSIGVQILNNTGVGPHPMALNGKVPTGRCVDYLIEGNTLSGAVDWTLWLGHCLNVTVRSNKLTGGNMGIYCIFDVQGGLFESNTFSNESTAIQFSNYGGQGGNSNITVRGNTYTNVRTQIAGQSNVTNLVVE